MYSHELVFLLPHSPKKRSWLHYTCYREAVTFDPHGGTVLMSSLLTLPGAAVTPAVSRSVTRR